MKARFSPALIGGFVVGALALLAVLLLAIGGQGLLQSKERAVMHFAGSVYGLQQGAPVVFRGVQVGTVASIDLRWDDTARNYVIPVIAELDADVLRRLGAGVAGGRGSDALLAPLLQRGLRAQLGMQSIVTGQLYVDLDLRPGRPVRTFGPASGAARGLPEIPTQDAAIQNLKNQLEGLDLRQLVNDISETARSVRELAAGPELKAGVAEAAAAAADIRRLARRIESRVGPLADSATHTLARAGAAADRLGAAAQRVEEASANAGALLAPDSALVQTVQATAEDVARSASALRLAADGDGPLLQDTRQAAQDVSRAARALRDLARRLDDQPESLLKGRRDEP
jgi:paraquat-inducible protein B